uniref:Uncharacterized protein n=1 Tax=Theropithecus gelada TaxID=9565 RepID=A0A8D2FII9_THEGE
MAESGLDPYEYVSSHKYAMRRPTSLLWQPQFCCTDTDACKNDQDPVMIMASESTSSSCG